MKKADRQTMIKKIIEENKIETQDDLIRLLHEAGVQATQATISRDIRELGVVKTHVDTGQVRYAILSRSNPLTEEKLHDVFQDSVEKITQVQFMLILHTVIGTANVVAAILDEMNVKEIAGTIAGTDTLVIISPSNEDAKVLHERFLKYIND